ncbi:MAG: preprotein translocase subunit SecD [Frankiaceae bacterium]|nr:preprotein translocase subunit SecD [Frankiaceae bacterium]
MAAPKRASNPWRPLAVVLVAMIALDRGVGLGKTHTPALGLDLRGGTTVLLKPTNVTGNQKLTSDQMSRSREILQQRVNANGVSNAEVVVEGSDRIRINVPGEGRAVIDKVKQTALVRFRQVLVETNGTTTPDPNATVVPSPGATPGSTATGTPSASPSASSTASVSGTPSPSASATSNGRALPQQFLAATTPASPSVSASPTGSASPAASPSASGSPAAATPPPLVDGLPLYQSLDSVLADQTLYQPADLKLKPQTLDQLLSTYSCPPVAQITAVVPDTDAFKNKPIVACGRNGAKYLLGPELIAGAEIRKATAGLLQNSDTWLVNLELKSTGASIFGKATKAVVSYSSPFNQIAVVLDGVVESAPVIQAAITDGNAQISGSFDEQSANDLAKVLNFGALPVAFVVDTVATVSPTLGSDQLRAGLIAGGIALALVILYSLLYYRALGLVTIASLLASGALLYATLVLLGHSIGYTLTLAGIAGFIIAVGITADSFVVYFERLRDEIRDGRTPRVAVERGWERARRTILSADFVSLLAAGVLYFVSIGDVRGFAFTLGLSTISDLIIVFLFTKPLITLMVRSKWFANHPRASGLADRVDKGPASAATTTATAGQEA